MVAIWYNEYSQILINAEYCKGKWFMCGINKRVNSAEHRMFWAYIMVLGKSVFLENKLICFSAASPDHIRNYFLVYQYRTKLEWQDYQEIEIPLWRFIYIYIYIYNIGCEFKWNRETGKEEEGQEGEKERKNERERKETTWRESQPKRLMSADPSKPATAQSSYLN